MSNSKQSSPVTSATAAQQMRRLTRRSFVTGSAAALAGLGAWYWLTTASEEGDVPWPIRRVLRFNQALAEALGSPHHLAPTFSPEHLQGPARTNGSVGLEEEVQAADWQVIIQHENRAGTRRIRLQEIQQLPRQDLVTELKCVEGWSEVMQFGGVRLVDFVTHFGLATRSGRAPDPAGNPHDLFRYVYLATPDEGYYVGLDLASALHPQTLLCDTMNGQALTSAHGAPLRLYLSVKYGFKSLKRIGLIRFQDQRPRDYWGDRGYDWYAAL